MQMTYEQMLKIALIHDKRDLYLLMNSKWMYLNEIKNLVREGKATVLCFNDYSNYRFKTPEFDKISNFEDAFDFQFSIQEQLLIIKEYKCESFYGNREELDIIWTVRLHNPEQNTQILRAFRSRIEYIVEDIREEERRIVERKEQDRVKNALLAEIS